MSTNHRRERTELEMALYESNVTYRDIAEELGCTYECVRQIAAGHRQGKGRLGRRVLRALKDACASSNTDRTAKDAARA